LGQGAIPARQTFGVVTRVARQLGIGTESLRNWLKQAEIDSGRQAGTPSAYAQRIAELERENRELRRANDILKPRGLEGGSDHGHVTRGRRPQHGRLGPTGRRHRRFRLP
jgi:transposase-like protein